MLKEVAAGEFPGGPVARTPRHRCRGRWFSVWLGNERPVSRVAWSKRKKKKEERKGKRNLNNLVQRKKELKV